MGDAVDVLHVGDSFVAPLDAAASGAVRRTVYGADETVAVLDELGDPGARVDCVVCEHPLDDVDVVDFLDSLVEWGAGVPVVLLTDAGSESLASEAISAGVTEYVSVADADWAAAAAAIERCAREGRTGPQFHLETSFRHLVEQNIAGVFEVQGEEFTYVNPTFADVFGYSQAELIGRSPLDLVVEADRATLRENMAALARGDAESAVWRSRTSASTG
ncbi:MAG: PAS domain S-box protein [Halobacteriaceae archaeon]